MIEAKDTVINRTIIRKCLNKEVSVDKKLKPVLALQAEFSYNTAKILGRKEGIKEVVDWIKAQGLTNIQIDWKSMQSSDKFADVYQLYPEDLATKLKEWEIES